MQADIRPPHIEGDVKTQVEQIRSYLLYLADQLNFLFSAAAAEIPEIKEKK